jgi:Holliday junction DNA helicase RuvB
VTTGRKPDLKTEARTLPPLTLIGATTDPARVKPALRERCAIQLKMEYYTPEVLAEIIKDMLAAIGGFTVSDENALELARRCRGNTRNARNHCKKLEAIALAKGTKTIDAAILGEIFEEDIDARGLGKPEIDYLKALIIKYGGGPVGVEVLASAIGEQKQNVIKDIEPYLHYLGMVNIAGGRVATEEAYKHLGVKKAEGGGAGAPDDGPESDY